MTTERKPILVKFPPEVLANIDAQAKMDGMTRMAVIVQRCAGGPIVHVDAEKIKAPKPSSIFPEFPVKAKMPKGVKVPKVEPRRAPTPHVQVGPSTPKPGAMLKTPKGAKSK